MNQDTLKEAIREELPALLRDDPQLRAFIADLMQERYADRRGTEDRFYAVLDELRRDREEQACKWDEQMRKWDEQGQTWDEQGRRWDEQMRKWDEQGQTWEEQGRRWDEQMRQWEGQRGKWDTQERKWEEQARQWEEHRKQQAAWGERWDAQLAEMKADRIENQRRFAQTERNIDALATRLDRSIGGLGARWGLKSEATFRNALAGVLEDHFGVQVLRVDEYDEEGAVFGRPDQVELDVIIKNGLLIIAELKSSIDKAGMYVFERKARFFERRHNRKATRLMVISPMIDRRAKKVAEELGIELFSDSVDVESLDAADD